MKTEAIEQAIRQLGLDSKDWRTDELAAAALNELAALRQESRMAVLWRIGRGPATAHTGLSRSRGVTTWRQHADSVS